MAKFANLQTLKDTNSLASFDLNCVWYCMNGDFSS